VKRSGDGSARKGLEVIAEAYSVDDVHALKDGTKDLQKEKISDRTPCDAYRTGERSSRRDDHRARKSGQCR
jgi:hypothetical protein